MLRLEHGQYNLLLERRRACHSFCSSEQGSIHEKAASGAHWRRHSAPCSAEGSRVSGRLACRQTPD